MAIASHRTLLQPWSSMSQLSPDVLTSLSWREQALLRSGIFLEKKAFLFGERFWWA